VQMPHDRLHDLLHARIGVRAGAGEHDLRGALLAEERSIPGVTIRPSPE
jgi:hypothetical protein